MANNSADIDAIAQALDAAFDDFRIESCKFMGAGFNSVAVLVNGDMIFRVAKKETAGERYKIEWALLSELNPHVPIEIPMPQWLIESADGLPHGAIGYRRLHGEPLEPEALDGSRAEIAADIAKFLESLHGFSADRARGIGVPERSVRIDDLPELLRAVRSHFSREEYRRLRAWADELADDTVLPAYEPALCHGDLWHQNVLIDENGRVQSVLDFEEAHIGDPSQDFATLLDLGEPLVREIADTYFELGGRRSAVEWHRVRRHYELRPFGGLRYSVENDDETELTAAIEKLRTGPIVSGESGK